VLAWLIFEKTSARTSKMARLTEVVDLAFINFLQEQKFFLKKTEFGPEDRGVGEGWITPTEVASLRGNLQKNNRRLNKEKEFKRPLFGPRFRNTPRLGKKRGDEGFHWSILGLDDNCSRYRRQINE